MRSKQTPRLKELQVPAESIQALKKGYLYKTLRMNTLLNTIGSNIAVFECFDSEYGSFYSDSLWTILAIDEGERQKLTEDTKRFKKFMEKLESEKGADQLVAYQDKILEIQTYYISDAFIGAVFDRTEEMQKQKALQNRLDFEKQIRSIDALSGILNRSGFETEVRALISNNQKGTMLAFDLDNFKTVNDALGHPEGDKVLVIFAQCLRNVFGEEGISGRLGGDEFAVFLPDNIPHKVMALQVRRILSEARTALSAYQPFQLSVSAGVAVISQATEVTDYDTLYASADAALYIAKRQGKNSFFINKKGIRCMSDRCVYCREKCPRRTALKL